MPRAAIARSRAPTAFSVRIKTVSVQKTRLWIKARAVWRGFYTRSSIAHGCAVRPCAIDDPRGRFLVRATSQLCNNEWARLRLPRIKHASQRLFKSAGCSVRFMVNERDMILRILTEAHGCVHQADSCAAPTFPMNQQRWQFWIDRGGTFTDIVARRPDGAIG